MSLFASNNRIIVSGPDGRTRFDTSEPMPHILATYELTNIEVVFPDLPDKVTISNGQADYEIDESWWSHTRTLIQLPWNIYPDFLLIRCIAWRQTAHPVVPGMQIVNHMPNGAWFLANGSTYVEGATRSAQRGGEFARMMHIYAFENKIDLHLQHNNKGRAQISTTSQVSNQESRFIMNVSISAGKFSIPG